MRCVRPTPRWRELAGSAVVRWGGGRGPRNAGLGVTTAALRGRVQSGKADARQWLKLCNASCCKTLGHAVYPGCLNLVLERDFTWFEPTDEPHVIRFGRRE